MQPWFFPPTHNIIRISDTPSNELLPVWCSLLFLSTPFIFSQLFDATIFSLRRNVIRIFS